MCKNTKSIKTLFPRQISSNYHKDGYSYIYMYVCHVFVELKEKKMSFVTRFNHNIVPKATHTHSPYTLSRAAISINWSTGHVTKSICQRPVEREEIIWQHLHVLFEFVAPGDYSIETMCEARDFWRFYVPSSFYGRRYKRKMNRCLIIISYLRIFWKLINIYFFEFLSKICYKNHDVRLELFFDWEMKLNECI